MAIYPDKKGRGQPTGRFRVEVQLNGARLRGRFNSLEEARKAEEKWKRKLASGDTEGATVREDGRGAPMTITQLVTKAAPLLWNGSEHGLDAERMVLWIAEHLRDPKLSELNTGHIDEVILWLRAEGRADTTINRYLSALHTVLDWGHKPGRSYVPVMPEFGWLEEDSGRLRWLSREEEVRLVATLVGMGQDAMADFIMAAIDTGCRRSELLALHPKQLDGTWLRLWGKPNPATKWRGTKTGETRSVPLTPRALDILSRRLPWGFSDPQLRYWFDRAKATMGLAEDREFCVHACRHTTATRLVERGVNLRVVQKFMGHRAIETTLGYAHVSDELLADAATKLSRVDLIDVRTGMGAIKGGSGGPEETPSVPPDTAPAQIAYGGG